ncbi:DUF5641 domain-containing protein [Aphis craccivora]|uniref:DUF5641 domain-containing protein n=1 Tax=Aphis craccivora TaxID=307492 RepID=A0A6G0ZDU2_APHCR|nr:DUF5641 domain-containing protein [Aphis craccivora]
MLWTQRPKRLFNSITRGSRVRIGSVVLMKEGGKILQWKLAKVLKLHSGRDNVARVVKLQTSKGQFTCSA